MTISSGILSNIMDTAAVSVAVMLVLQIGGIYDVRSSDGSMWHVRVCFSNQKGFNVGTINGGDP
jgi:hypothetical protein